MSVVLSQAISIGRAMTSVRALIAPWALVPAILAAQIAVLTLGACSTPAEERPIRAAGIESADTLSAAVRRLAVALADQLESRDLKTLGVAGFTDLGGFQSVFNDYLAEELTTALYSAGSFSMVEKRELDRLLAEHQDYATGNFDITTIADALKFAGADALVTGSVTRISNRVRVNVRAVDVTSRLTIAAAAASFVIDPDVGLLLSQPAVPPGQVRLTPYVRVPTD